MDAPVKSPIRVVVIDDQAAIQKALCALVEAEPDMQVVGVASDGEEGLKVVYKTQPDVVLLDLEMPRMDGFAFLRLLMHKRPTAVVVVSSHSARESVFRALELGALEFVAKPTSVPDLSSIRDSLLSKVRLARRLEVVTLTERARMSVHEALAATAQPPARHPLPEATGPRLPERVLCIGASTGGPTSILTLLRGLSADLPLGILVTQHMPEKFTSAFAERLERTTRWTVREAEPGAWVVAGQVLVASGSFSLRVKREGKAVRVQPPIPGESREQGFVPSVDLMMESAAQALGPQVIAAILTGMAGDGVRGVLAVRGAGGKVLAEAPESAIIASMPEEAIRSGAVDAVVPLKRMAEVITRLVGGR